MSCLCFNDVSTVFASKHYSLSIKNKTQSTIYNTVGFYQMSKTELCSSFCLKLHQTCHTLILLENYKYWIDTTCHMLVTQILASPPVFWLQLIHHLCKNNRNGETPHIKSGQDLERHQKECDLFQKWCWAKIEALLLDQLTKY